MTASYHTARHEELKQKGHLYLDSLKLHFPEKKIRKYLSRAVGVQWEYINKDSGFHFSHSPTIKQMEKAVAWLALAESQKSLTPRIHPKEPVLSFSEMKSALARLPKRKKLPWWRRLLLCISR
jgi:hypothetical protein